MKTKTEVFYTPHAASELVGLTEWRIAKLCEKLGTPMLVCSIPKHPDGIGQGVPIIPARMLERFGAMMDEAGQKMLVRLSGEDGEGKGVE